MATTKAEPKLHQLHNKELIPIVIGRHRPRAKHCVKIKESHNRADKHEWGKLSPSRCGNTLAKQVNQLSFKEKDLAKGIATNYI